MPPRCCSVGDARQPHHSPAAKMAEALVCHQKRKRSLNRRLPQLPEPAQPAVPSSPPHSSPCAWRTAPVTIGPGSPIVASAKAPGRAGGVQQLDPWSRSCCGSVLARCAVPRFVSILSLLLQAPDVLSLWTYASRVASRHRSTSHDRPRAHEQPLEITQRRRPRWREHSRVGRPAVSFSQLGGGITTQISIACPSRPIGDGRLPPGAAYIYPDAHIGQPIGLTQHRTFRQESDSRSPVPGGRDPLTARPRTDSWTDRYNRVEDVRRGLVATLVKDIST